jgi:hypothetical protein
MDEAWSGLLLLPLLLFALIPFGLFVWSVVWAYSDAEQRGKSGCLVALLVMFMSWPVGLIAWIIFRPEDRRL